MAENERKPEELEVDGVTELEEGELDSASGGTLSDTDLSSEPNTNCNNTQCCG
jgi:hypothetical protein